MSYSKIIKALSKAQSAAREEGVYDLFRIGLVREIVLADFLKHKLILKKRDSDAVLGRNKFEYLTCLEGGSFQFHRMHKNSLIRITRNKLVFCAVFFRSNPLKIKNLYKVQPAKMKYLAEKKIQNSKNEYAHISFSLTEIQSIGQEIRLS